MAQCIVPGCSNRAFNNIGIRLRRPNTTAIWAPNTNAFVCDLHATAGFDIQITLTSNSSGHIRTDTGSPSRRITRTTPIN
jgi:hypothetical protein